MISRGRKVTAFGVLFGFRGVKGTIVRSVKDMVKESWFISAIEEEPDFFLLVGCVLQVHRITKGFEFRLDTWPLPKITRPMNGLSFLMPSVLFTL